MLVFFGPEDRHPRLLYWSVLVVLIADVAFGVLRIRNLRYADPDQIYFHRIAFGTVMSAVIPAIVLVAVWVGKPIAAAIYAVIKGFSCLNSLGFAYGSSLVGRRISPTVVVLFILWNVVLIVVLFVYAVHRLRERRTQFRVVSRRKLESCWKPHDEGPMSE